ncbi:DUF4236 domain-containing protein [Clostridium sp. 19966]|uniref:DUF4236 domain-containing protein n=1 Tax=Clostridium sp. 19966 TaxID=2768166 RepID=UPI0028E076CF|nr:DUF4236 domain-containing protein [Clostridium sp. 19966]MDT8718996.1 DUF4236 domain-containing protein [Clostridium sp. 19966]
MFLFKSFKLGKHIRVNTTKNGISSVSIGGKNARLGVNKKGLYTSANKDGFYVREQLTNNKQSRNNKNNNSGSNASSDLTLWQLLKLCIGFYIFILILDGLTFKSGILLYVLGALDILFFIICGIGVIGNKIKEMKRT